MTFAESDILDKLEDESKQTKRLPPIGSKSEVNQILGELIPIKSGRLHE